jgi:predicted transcriptional regulator
MEVKQNKSEFINLIILMYFNSIKVNPSFTYLAKTIGVSIHQVYDRIELLIESNSLCIDDNIIFRITPKGLKTLEENHMDKIDYFKVVKEDNHAETSGINKDIIYIPKDFNDKFQGY